MPQTNEKARLQSTGVCNPSVPVGKREVEAREMNTVGALIPKTVLEWPHTSHGMYMLAFIHTNT